MRVRDTVGRMSVRVGTLVLGCMLAACGAGDRGAAPPATTPVTSVPTNASGTGPADPSESPSADPSAEPSDPSAEPSAEPRRVTLVATGDVLLHPPLWRQAKADAARTGRGDLDFAPMLAPIRPIVAGADLALCHLETPLAAASGPFRGYPLFSGPPQVVDALDRTGYDACSTASNHTFDQGAAGIRRTLDALDDAGIAHAGSARTAEEAARTTVVDVHGVRVALLSYTYGFNGNSYPGGDRWRADVIDERRILAEAAAAREDGAEIVVLSLHWGTEYVQTPNKQQVDVSRRLARSTDIDVIISHHAHVVEPIRKIGRTWVVYGLGNLMAWHSTPGDPNAEGLLVRFTFTETKAHRFAVTTAEYEPIMVARAAPIRVLDVPKALRDGRYGSSTRARLQAALDRTTRVVTSLGADDDGLVPITAG